MKKTIIITVTLMLLTFSMVTIYSCSKRSSEKAEAKNLDASTLADIDQNISREELAALSMQEQMVIFEGLTSANKLRIYEEKLELILNTETLTQAEIDHLNEIESIVTTSMYEGTWEGEPQSILDWIEYAENTLGWTEEKIYWYVETWSTPTEMANRPIDMGGGEPRKCVCRKHLACLWGYGIDHDTCTSGCSQTRTGCGFFGLMPCVGDCQ